MPLRLDLTGQVFGKLTVIQFVGNTKNGGKKYECLCLCGNRTIVATGNLRNGHTTSCGCFKQEIARINGRKVFRNIVSGQQFGRLTVLERAGTSCSGNVLWRCLCSCGNELTTVGSSLFNGSTQSCGCRHTEARRRNGQKRAILINVGQVFGRLTVLAYHGTSNHGHRIYTCQCLCGNQTLVSASALVSGNTQSCDCARRSSPQQKYLLKRACYQRRQARKRELPDTFTDEHLSFMLGYWKFACAICGREDGLLWTLSMDHWVPLASVECPGTVITNILPMCFSKKRVRNAGIRCCNSSKQDQDPIVWLTQKLGPRRAKAKLREIEVYFAAARAFAEAHVASERCALVRTFV